MSRKPDFMPTRLDNPVLEEIDFGEMANVTGGCKKCGDLAAEKQGNKKRPGPRG